jgi:hypothetical protein
MSYIARANSSSKVLPIVTPSPHFVLLLLYKY